MYLLWSRLRLYEMHVPCGADDDACEAHLIHTLRDQEQLQEVQGGDFLCIHCTCPPQHLTNFAPRFNHVFLSNSMGIIEAPENLHILDISAVLADALRPFVPR